jgi:hypothetical protein
LKDLGFVRLLLQQSLLLYWTTGSGDDEAG